MQLQVEDICMIIEKCAEHGVVNIKLGDTEINFRSKETIERTLPYSQAREDYNQPSTEVEQEEDNRKALEEIQRIRVDDDISNLMLEDPAEYERMVATGELDQIIEKFNLNDEEDDGKE